MDNTARATDITLFDHQVQTRNFILQNKKCFVLDEIGLGKTISALEACEELILARKISKVLIIAPIAVMEATWVAHILKHYHHRKFELLHGGNRVERVEALNRRANYYIINTDGIKTIFDDLYTKSFEMIVVDESTTFANHKSDRTKAAWSLCNEAKSVVCLTGEPTPNDLIQAYSQAKLIHYDHPKYFTHFRDSVKIKLDMYNYIDKPGAIDIVREVLQPAIKHTRDACLDLPPITFETRDIVLSKMQEKLYKEMERDYITWVNDNVAVSAANAAVRATKLMQISAGIVIDPDSNHFTIDHKARLAELDNVFSSLPIKKLIIFATFTKSINGLVEHFGGRAKKIDGSVTKKGERARIIKDFQEGDLEILIGQPKAISHGVNLQTSNTIVWWSPTFSNESYQQCNGRIRRAGQLRPQLVINFQSTKIEKHVYKALARKQKVSESLLEMF
jgi:SNF2 family DNA or RNA helicase